MDLDKVFEINKTTWNERVPVHYESFFYDKFAFAKAKNSLNTYELEALGDVKGLSLLHLQCHFGQDSLSWANQGARVTAVDFSETAIAKARELSESLDIPAMFVCCNVLDTSRFVTEQFNVVFASYGTIGWLPDLKPWAIMIAEKLKVGGRFYLIEFHPICWMIDYVNDPLKIAYHYNQNEAIYEEYKGTYADKNASLLSKEYGWNHALSDVIQSLINAGLKITTFQEYDGSPYEVFPNMEQQSNGLFYLKNKKYPTLFEIMAVKE